MEYLSVSPLVCLITWLSLDSSLCWPANKHGFVWGQYITFRMLITAGTETFIKLLLLWKHNFLSLMQQTQNGSYSRAGEQSAGECSNGNADQFVQIP